MGIPTTHCFFQGNDLQLSVECLCCCSIVAMELGAVQMSSKSLGGVVKSVGFYGRIVQDVGGMEILV